MEKEFIIFKIKIFTLEIGNKINFLVKEFIYMLIWVKNSKESLLMGWNQVEECIHIKVEQFMKVNGLKIESQDLVFIHMLINKNMKEIG